MTAADDSADDAAFWACYGLLNSPDEPTRARAWSDAFTWCFDHGDRLAYSCVLAAFSDGVRQGRMPPASAMESLSLIFDTFRAGASFDSAFGMSKLKRGRPSTLGQRMTARSRASSVSYFMSSGMSMEEAAEHVAASRAFGFGKSAAQIKRDYLRFAKAPKAKRSRASKANKRA